MIKTIDLIDTKNDLNISEFLSLFDYGDDYIEIREIGDTGAESKFFAPEDIKDYKPNLDLNVYFGVYGRKNTDSGKDYNTTTTSMIWVDYDNFQQGSTLAEKLLEVEIALDFEDIPIPTLIVSSGNGLHLYWRLTEPTPKNVSNINRALAEAIGGDLRATDRARILRLPHTYNVKDRGDIKACRVIEYNDISYNLEEMEKLTDTLATDRVDAGIKESVKREIELDQLLKSKGISINWPCIETMIQGVPKGQRNFALGRLVNYFRDIEKLTINETLEIIELWNTYNRPPEAPNKLRKDFYSYWRAKYKLLGCGATNRDLRTMLKPYCNSERCSRYQHTEIAIKRDNMINIPIELLKDMSDVKPQEIIILGLLEDAIDGLTKEELEARLTVGATKKQRIGSKALRESLKSLIKRGYVKDIQGYRLAGEKTEYHYQENYTVKRYIKLSYGLIRGVVSEDITLGEFMVYVTMEKLRQSNSKPTRSLIARELRVKDSGVNSRINNLKKIGYISTVYDTWNGIEYATYKLRI